MNASMHVSRYKYSTVALEWVKVVLSPQTSVERSTGTMMVGYWLKAEAPSSPSKNDDGQDKGQDKAEQGSAQQSHGSVAPRSHGTRMDEGRRAVTRRGCVRANEFRVGDDWAGGLQAARG